MKLRERLAHLLAGGYITEVAHEAATTALREAAAQVDPDEYLYRSMNQGPRDLARYDLTRAQDYAYTQYQQNALGHRLTDLMPDFIVGDGITWDSTNPQVADVVEEFWNDDVNNLELRQHDFARELGLFGELIPQALTGEVSGVVQLGYIDPGQVKHISHADGNSIVADQVHLRVRGEDRSFDVIRDRGSGVLEGDVFLFQVNSLSNSTRGWPDLMSLVDWLDVYDAMLWEMAERNRLARSFIWDVTIEGDEAAVEQWLRKHGDTPRSGSVRAHNKGVEWNAVAPTLGSFETAQEADVQLAHIAGSSGIPKHWLSSSADVNRATAQEMGAPTIRMLSRRQAYYVACLRRILRYVVERACKAGRIRNNDGNVQVFDDAGNPAVGPDGSKLVIPAWRTVRLHAPEISPRDTYRAGQLLLQLTQALALAESGGWFGKDTSRRALAAAMAQMGVEFDPAEEPTPAPEEQPQTVTQPTTEEPGQNGQAAVTELRRG